MIEVSEKKHILHIVIQDPRQGTVVEIGIDLAQEREKDLAIETDLDPGTDIGRILEETIAIILTEEDTDEIEVRAEKGEGMMKAVEAVTGIHTTEEIEVQTGEAEEVVKRGEKILFRLLSEKGRNEKRTIYVSNFSFFYTHL